MEFTSVQHNTWKTLFARQQQKVEEYACAMYLRGLELLELPDERIPTLAELNRRITPRTAWRCVRTKVRYSDAVPWYESFSRREFMVTDYMRGSDELEFTPEPDMFHDIFGHLPFMTLPPYTELQEMFAPAFHSADPSEREDIKRLAWFSTEFGLIQQVGELKIFGAGLISSSGEMEHVLSGRVAIEPFTIENVLQRDKAVWEFNDTLFAFDSLGRAEARATPLLRAAVDPGARGRRVAPQRVSGGNSAPPVPLCEECLHAVREV